MLTPEPDSQPDRSAAVVAKWGAAIDAGFQLVPDVLLKNQHRIGLSATEMVVLLNLTMHWWYPERHPYPRPTTIARRMGVSSRTVQRALNRLSRIGLIERCRNASGGPTGEASTAFRLEGLVKELEPLALADVAYRPRVSTPMAPQPLEYWVKAEGGAQ